jgi:O-antigen/teichoic acid export membrane protein
MQNDHTGAGEGASRFDRFFRGASYGILSAAVSRLFASLGAAIIARLLGASDFGVYINLIALVNLLNILCLFGTNTAFTSFIPRYHSQARENIASIVAAGYLLVAALLTLGVITLAMGGDVLSTSFYGGEIPAEHIRMLSVFLIGLTLNTVTASVLYGFQEFRLHAFTTILTTVSVTVLSVAGILLSGVSGFIVGAAVGYGGNAGLQAFLVFSRHGNLLTGSRISLSGAIKELVRFTLPAFLSGLFVAPSLWIGNLLLVRFGDVSSSGYFGVANSLAQLVLLLPLTVGAPMVPLLAELNASKDETRFDLMVRRNIKLMWAITMPFAILFGVPASFLITLVYGDHFASSVPTYLLLIGQNCLIAIESVAGYVLIAKNKMWDSLLANAIWFVLFIVLALWLIRDAGHVGYGLALFVSYALFGLVLWMVIRRHVHLSLLTPGTFLAAAATTAIFAIIWFLARFIESPVVIVVAAIGLSVLVALIEWSRFFSPDERALARGKLDSLLGSIHRVRS